VGIELVSMAMDQIKKKSTCQVQCKAGSGGAASFHMCAIVRHQNLYQATNRGQGHIRFLLLYQGSSPFTHCATTAPVLRHQCWYCATSAGTPSKVPVLHHQCRYCVTSAGTAPPVPVYWSSFSAIFFILVNFLFSALS
jgi:hypothetical protein